MLKNKRLLIHAGIIALFSLIPLLWLHNGQAILGHDAGFPLSPWMHFLDRLFVWTHRFGLGNDQTTEVGGFFIHGFEGIIDRLGFSLTNVQRITFITYFLGFGFSMYYFARTLFPEREKYFPLFASLLYMINHFVLQAWFIVERTKFSLYIALPLLLAIVLKLSKRELNPVQAALLSATTVFFLNGGGFAPLFGAILICLPLTGVMLFLFSEAKKQLFKDLLIYVGLLLVSGILINFFWILPYVRFVMTSFSLELASAGGASGVIAWVKAISESASYYNMMRLQGIQEWYVNPLHPYAKDYLENFWFYMGSYLPFFLAFGSYLVMEFKDKKRIVLLLMIALVGMFFMAGSHPPFGEIYIWMIKNIPGFTVFRTPFYKFAPALWLSFSLLIAYTVEVLITKKVKPTYQHVVALGCIVLFCLYMFPFFTGSFFDYEVGRKTTKVTTPQYVFDYAKWANSNTFPYKRLLLLPGQNPNTRFEAYTWKFWSLAQIQGLLNNRSYIGNSLYKTVSEEAFIKNLYEKIENMDPTWVDEAQYLFVDAVLLRKDFDWQLTDSQTVNPALLEKFLIADKRFKKVREFGEWSVWELANTNASAFTFKDYYYEVHAQDKEHFFQISTLDPVKLDPKTVFVEDPIKGLEDRRKGVVYVPHCVHCQLDQPRLFEIDRGQIVTPGSIFYERKKQNDEQQIRSTRNQKDRIETVAQIATRRFYEVQAQIQRKVSHDDRIAGWKNLLEILTILDKEINTYTSSYASSVKNNEFLSIQYENVHENLRNLAANIKEINSDEEADVYLKIKSTWEHIQDNLVSVMWYSKDNLDKKYLFESLEDLTADVYVQSSTSNAYATDSARQKPTIWVDGKQYPVIDTADQNGWRKISVVGLKKGMNQVQFSDVSIKRALGKDGTAKLTLGADDKCTSIPVGDLQREQYAFTIEATADKDLSEFYVFIDNVKGKLPLLPYWGRRLTLESGKTVYLDYIDRFYEPGTYEMKFCKLGSLSVSDRTIELKNLSIERITAPVLAFVAKKDVLPSTSTLKIDVDEKNQTDYSLTISGTGTSLLMFDQRFDTGWEANPSTIFQSHSRVHGYANGWNITKSEPDDQRIHFQYVGQRLYYIGWTVSLITFVLSQLILVYLWKKK